MVVFARSDSETNELSYSKSIKESGASMAARALRLRIISKITHTLKTVLCLNYKNDLYLILEYVRFVLTLVLMKYACVLLNKTT